MPSAPASPCRQGDCPKRRPCPDHAAAIGAVNYAARGSRTQRGYGPRWEKTRARILRLEPVCRGCSREFSNEVDHILPLERGGKTEDRNLQGLCKTCHSRKTGVERRLTDPAQVMTEVRALAAADRRVASAPAGAPAGMGGINP